MSTQNGSDDGAPRFEFGRNWHDFIQRNFGAERIEIAKGHLFDFLDRESLEGLDVRCSMTLENPWTGIFQRYQWRTDGHIDAA